MLNSMTDIQISSNRPNLIKLLFLSYQLILFENSIFSLHDDYKTQSLSVKDARLKFNKKK